MENVGVLPVPEPQQEMLIKKAEFGPIGGAPGLKPAQAPLEALGDVVVELSVELGRAAVPVREVLEWRPETVLRLDKVAGEPLNVLVNGYPLGTGEVVVVGDRLGVRLRAFAEEGR